MFLMASSEVLAEAVPLVMFNGDVKFLGSPVGWMTGWPEASHQDMAQHWYLCQQNVGGNFCVHQLGID